MLELISYDRPPVSLDPGGRRGRKERMGDLVARIDPRNEPAEAVSNGLLRNDFEIALATLSEREVIRLQLGLDDGRPQTLDEVGREFGLSPGAHPPDREDHAPQSCATQSRARRLEVYAS